MKKIYKVTQAQLATLQNGGSITVGDTAYTYETGSDVAYVIVDPSHPEYALTQTDNKLQFRKNGTVADSLIVDFSKASSYATKARNLEYDEGETGVGAETLHFNLYTGGTVKGLTTFKGGLKSEQEPTDDTDVANKAYVKKVFDDAYPTGALAAVATSGSYNDLKDKPTIPSAVSVSNNNPTLSWGNTSEVGKVNNTALTVTMPSNPNTDTNYYPTHIYTSGLRLSTGQGSTDCELYVPHASWTSAGVYPAPYYGESEYISLSYGSSSDLNSCSWTLINSMYKVSMLGLPTSNTATSRIYFVWFKISSNIADDRWFKVDFKSDYYTVLSAQATATKTSMSSYGVGIVTNCTKDSSRYCYIGVDEYNICEGINVFLVVKYSQ